jgi:hypothetical protein
MIRKCFFPVISIFGVIGITGTADLKAEDVLQAKAPRTGKFDSQSYSEDPVYHTTFPEAPGMTFDVPPDFRIIKTPNSIQLEPPTHYVSRKIEAQDKLIKEFGEKLENMTERLKAAEEKIKRLEPESAPTTPAGILKSEEPKA